MGYQFVISPPPLFGYLVRAGRHVRPAKEDFLLNLDFLYVMSNGMMQEIPTGSSIPNGARNLFNTMIDRSGTLDDDLFRNLKRFVGQFNDQIAQFNNDYLLL